MPQPELNTLFRSLSRLCDLLMNFFSEVYLCGCVVTHVCSTSLHPVLYNVKLPQVVVSGSLACARGDTVSVREIRLLKSSGRYMTWCMYTGVMIVTRDIYAVGIIDPPYVIDVW